jgi:hypothetical protein
VVCERIQKWQISYHRAFSKLGASQSKQRILRKQQITDNATINTPYEKLKKGEQGTSEN